MFSISRIGYGVALCCFLAACSATSPATSPPSAVAPGALVASFEATRSLEPDFFDAALLEDLRDLQAAIDVVYDTAIVDCLMAEGFVVPQPDIHTVASEYDVMRNAPLTYTLFVRNAVDRMDARLDSADGINVVSDHVVTVAEDEAMLGAYEACVRAVPPTVNALSDPASWYAKAEAEASDRVDADPRHVAAIQARLECEIRHLGISADQEANEIVAEVYAQRDRGLDEAALRQELEIVLIRELQLNAIATECLGHFLASERVLYIDYLNSIGHDDQAKLDLWLMELHEDVANYRDLLDELGT